MSKKDRYSHLGDESDDESTTDNADDSKDPVSTADVKENEETAKEGADGGPPKETEGIHVTISDGSEEVVVDIDDGRLSIDDLEDRIDELVDNVSAVTDNNSGGDMNETEQLYTNCSPSIHSPLAHGIRASSYLTRASSIYMSAGAQWMEAILQPQYRDD